MPDDNDGTIIRLAKEHYDKITVSTQDLDHESKVYCNDLCISNLVWIFIGAQKPPINIPFLATTHYGVEKVVYDGKNYVGYSSCHCCRTNGCEIQYFDYWMPMPKPYRPHEEFGKNVLLLEEGKDA